MRKKTIPIFLLFVISWSLYGQDDTLTISRAVKIAMENNPKVQQLKQQKEQQKFKKRSSTGIANPELVYFKEGINEETNAPFAEQRIAINQSIDFPLTSFYRLKAINNEYISADYKIQSFKTELKAKVKKQYIRVLYASHIQELRRRQIQLMNELQNAVRTKKEVGEATKMDLMSVDVRLNQARNKLDNAEKLLHEARYNLFNFMGLEPEKQKYSINFSDTLNTNPQFVQQDTALNYISRSPQIQTIAHKIKASQYRIHEAQSGYLPDINFSYYQQDYGSGYEYNGFEIGISLPLWAPLNEQSHIKMQTAKNRELGWKKTETELNIKKKIEHAWHGYETLKQNIDRYDSQIRPKARKLKNKTLEAYRLGQVNFIKIIDSQSLFLETEANYLAALRDYYLQMIELEKYMNRQLVY